MKKVVKKEKKERKPKKEPINFILLETDGFLSRTATCKDIKEVESIIRDNPNLRVFEVLREAKVTVSVDIA